MTNGDDEKRMMKQEAVRESGEMSKIKRKELRNI